MRMPQGTVWNAARVVVAQGCVLARLLIVAAFIPASELGLYALAGSVLAGAAALAETGARQQYMVQSADSIADTDLALWTAWLTNAGTKAAMLVLSALAGVAAAWLYGDATIGWLVVATSATILLTSLGGPELLRLEKARQFRPIALIDMVAQAIALILSTVMVMRTHSVWAIVVGAAAAAVIAVILSYACLKRLPWRRPPWPMVWRMASDGRHFSIIAFTTFITSSLDKLLLGLFVSQAQLGVYFLAQRIGEAPMRFITEVTSRPLLVHYATLRAEQGNGQLAREERHHARALAVYAVLAAVAAIVAMLLVAGSGLKPSWRTAMPLTAIFLMAYGMRAACQIPALAILAMDRVDIDARYKVQESIVMVPLLAVACAWAGTWGAAVVFLGVYIVSFVRRHLFVIRHAISA